MVKMGVYGIILLTSSWLPAVSRPFAVLVLGLGVLSGSYGILQASITSDLKRLLAYSTTENVGLAVTAVGVGMLLSNAGQPEVASIAFVAALLLVVSHAAFKTVLFLGAGTILKATGERDLDRLGGLARTHPVTAWTFGLAAMGASALPITSGFVAEWTLLQAVVHGDGRANTMLALALPVTLGLLALTIGLGLLTFVKAFGMAFLARPRSDAAASPSPEFTSRPGTAAMGVAQVLGALSVWGLGLAAGPIATAFSSVLGYSGIVIERDGRAATGDDRCPRPGRARAARSGSRPPGGTPCAGPPAPRPEASDRPGMGLRRSPYVPAHGVHGDLVRRTARTRLRRGPAALTVSGGLTARRRPGAGEPRRLRSGAHRHRRGSVVRPGRALAPNRRRPGTPHSERQLSTATWGSPSQHSCWSSWW